MRVTVVGGGVAGLVAALQAQAQGSQVTLIERDSVVGGLLRSRRLFADGFPFDYGTHLLHETTDAALDRLLYGPEADRESRFRIYRVPEVGSHYRGLFTGNGYLADRFLPDEVRRQGLSDLLTARAAVHSSPPNLAVQLEQTFGRTYAESLVGPAVRKLYLTELSNLAPNSHLLFGLKRIVAGTPERARSLKLDPNLDRVLAFHSNTEGVSSVASLYPRHGGVGQWTMSLLDAFRSGGGTLITDGQVERITSVGRSITRLSGSFGTIDTDAVFWTVAAHLLLRMTGRALELPPPRLLTSLLIHMIVDHRPTIPSFYVQCYDPELTLFRVTLYSNFTDRAPQGFPITVEVNVMRAPASTEEVPLQILDELKRMGVFPASTGIVSAEVDIARGGFPVMSHQFVRATREFADAVNSAFDNVVLLGRASGRVFFQSDVILDVSGAVRRFLAQP